MRINKYLAIKGISSRRKVDELIKQGLVKVNSQKASLGTALEDGDLIEVQGQKFTYSKDSKQEKIILVFNKPVGVVCTNEVKEKNNFLNYLKTNPKNFLGDKKRYEAIMQSRLFSIGRLDKESSGLILLTNDGELCDKLTHPKYEKEKEYLVTCKDAITPEFIKNFCHGVEIEVDDKLVKTKKCKAKKLKVHQFTCVLEQGYKRQIRLMVKKLKNQVVELKRIRIADLKLGNLKEGFYYELQERNRSAVISSP